VPSRFLIFGNSGAGKSTLAKTLQAQHGLAHLDLDTLAWDPGEVPTRRSIEASLADIHAFLAREPSWVIEGCYADLLEPLLPHADALRFLNPGTEACIAHCRARPWEPHKYASKAEQDRNLEFLIAWVREYETRDGPLSLAAHRALFEAFAGDKLELCSSTEPS
jgi:adenylate kinase family enzyme